MIQRSEALVRLVFVDLFGSVIWFPIWWYTKGFKNFIKWCIQGLEYRAKQYAFKIWFKNFFIPMYGQYDLVGRLISVGMRFFVIIGRGIAIAAEAAVYFLFALAWIALPPIALLLALQNIFSGLFFMQLPF